MELKPGGRDIPVTNSNRISYIHLVADYRLNKQVSTSTSFPVYSPSPKPSLVMKLQPCWCPKPILYRLLNSFLLEALAFVSINLHGCQPREGKRSISTSVQDLQTKQVVDSFCEMLHRDALFFLCFLFTETHNLHRLFFFSDAPFYTHGGTVRLSRVRFVILDALKQLVRLEV